MNSKAKLKVAAKNIANFIYEQQFEGIITSGKSEIISIDLFSKAWTGEYEHSMPPMYNFGDEGNILLYQTKIDEFLNTGVLSQKRKDELNKFIDCKFPNLDRSQKLVYLEDLACSGLKLCAVSMALKEIGFNNMHYSVFAAQKRMQFPPELGSLYWGTQDQEVVWYLAQQICKIKKGETNHDF